MRAEIKEQGIGMFPPSRPLIDLTARGRWAAQWKQPYTVLVQKKE